MKKAERKKQLRERIAAVTVIVGMNLVWILLFASEYYANYIANDDYIEYWPTMQIHEKTVVVVPESEYDILIPMGEFKVTAYCSCKECCKEWADKRPVDDFGNILVIGAAGTLLEEGKSIAVDPDVIPYGSKVIIEGCGEYIAADRGVTGKEIDIYMLEHERADEHGVKYAEVYIVYDSNTGT